MGWPRRSSTKTGDGMHIHEVQGAHGVRPLWGMSP